MSVLLSVARSRQHDLRTWYQCPSGFHHLAESERTDYFKDPDFHQAYRV